MSAKAIREFDGKSMLAKWLKEHNGHINTHSLTHTTHTHTPNIAVATRTTHTHIPHHHLTPHHSLAQCSQQHWQLSQSIYHSVHQWKSSDMRTHHSITRD